MERLISNLVHTTHFWNNLYQVKVKRNRMSKNIKVFDTSNTNDINMIAKIVHLCLKAPGWLNELGS
jgi:hypothetical protein